MIQTPFDIYWQALAAPISVVRKSPLTDALDLYFRALALDTTALSPIPPVNVGFNRSRDDLRVYQVGTVKLIKRIWSDGDDKLPGIILAYDMGAGKSVSTLTALRDLLDDGTIKRALIIAPLLVAETVWPTEIEDWEHLRNTSYTLIRGTEKQRQELAQQDTEIHIINKELVPWLWMNSGRGSTWDYDVIVIDEASMLKNGKKRTKLKKLTRFGALAQARSKTSAIIELTGTPAPNGLQNLWGLVYIIDRGERLGDNQKRFMDRYFDVNQFSYKITERPHAKREITEAVKDIMFSLNPSDYTELPELVPLTIKVKLPPKILKEYRRFERTLISEEYEVDAATNAVLANKLLQYCIAGGTEVLTDAGWIPIENVTAAHRVWDGIEWVACSGNIFNGFQQTVDCYGVSMTKEHKVLTVDGWCEAKDVLYDDASIRVDREKVRLPDSITETRDYDRESTEGHLALQMRLRERSGEDIAELASSTSTDRNTELWLQARRDDISRARRSHDDRFQTMAHMVEDARTMPQSEGQGFQELRWPWYRHARRVVQFLQSLLARCSEGLCGSSVDRSSGQHEVLFEDQLPMGDCKNSDQEHQSKRSHINKMGGNHLSGGCGKSGPEIRNTLQKVRARGDRRIPDQTCKVAVYDLVDCGPRNRFVVRGFDGPLIVHNCNGSMYQEDGNDIFVHDCKLDALENLVEELDGTPLLVAYSYKFDLKRIRAKFPKAVVLNEVPDVMQTMREWNAGKIQMLLAHPLSAAHGLNMQYGSNQACWYGLNSDLELYQQFNKRLARPGSKSSHVFLHHIIAEDTHDEDILPALRNKEALQSDVLDATRIRFEGNL